MSSTALLIDVSQFVNYPVPTGVQRTLLAVARHWQGDEVTVQTGFRRPGSHEYVVTPLHAFRDALEWTFENRHDNGPGAASQQIIQRLAGHEAMRVTPDEIPDKFHGYMLPEPTFQDDILDTVELCSGRLAGRCMAMVYDGLQQTHPQFFPGPHTGSTDRYFLTVGRLDSLAFISRRTREMFENRFRRSAIPNHLDLPLGVDAFGRGSQPAPPKPRFVVVGTMEPRKRPGLILEAFERLWADSRDFELEFLGMPGWEPELTHYLRRRSRELDHFNWSEDVTDEELATAFRTASGAVFVSELEGYGLPAVEALALGCPVIVSEGLPAMDTLPDSGQIRLSPVTAETIAAAVERLSDPAENASLRQDIAGLDLPGWRQAVATLETWIANTLSNG